MFKLPQDHLHGHHHWITVAFVLAALLLTLTEVHGQTTTLGSGAMFQGRPEMAGAQGGLGAQAGPPTGGLGLEGTTGATRGLSLRKPSGLDTMGKPPTDPLVAVAPINTDGTLLNKDESLMRKSDDSIAREQTSAVKKTKRAVKRTVQRTRHGVSPIDAQAKIGTN